MSTSAPAAYRPAQGFTTARSQKWVLTSAMLTGVIYGVRRITGDTATPTSGSSAVKSLAGAGQPTSLAHWAVNYGIAYTMLALLAVAAPEAAASIAMMIVLGNLLANGAGIANDLKQLEGGS